MRTWNLLAVLMALTVVVSVCAERASGHGLGKALLVGLDAEELKGILGPGPYKRYTPKTITGVAELAAECQEIVADQVAYDLAEFREDTNCMASPVYDLSGRVIAAIGVSGPLERMNEKAMNGHSKRIRKCASQLSADLGHSGQRSPT